MNQDNKKNATKHYQNSEYPSGSFEAAINGDHQDRLRETTGLRLERHPLAPGNSGADLEEMVPAFMHRDFFRSEEDAVDAVDALAGSSRLRPVKRQVVAAPSAYTEPPNTEDAPDRSAVAQPPTPKQEPVFPRAESVDPPRVEVPIPPLRSSESPPTPESRSHNPEGQEPSPVTAPSAANSIVNSSRETNGSRSPYSIPMFVALALVLGIFAWREQTRPTVVAQEPLPVPKTVSSPPAPTPLPDPSVAPVGFRPTYMAVGPPVPAEDSEDKIEDPSLAPTPLAGEQEPEPGSDGSVEVDDEADERAAVLERMSQASQGEAASSSGQSEDLFPSDEEEVPTRTAAPVREAAARVPAAKPPVESKPKAQAKAEPKAVPVTATAADLFPIDEELPLSPAKEPKASSAAVVAPAQPPSQPAVPPSEGYRIDEPNL